MNSLAELTQDDGRRIGIPKGAAILIISQKEPDPERPKSKAMIRWCVNEAAGPQHSFVRDDLRQVRNLFPKAYAGLGWVEVESPEGDTVLIPEGTATGGYREVDDDLFELTLNVPTGPVTIRVKASFEQVRELVGLKAEPEAPPTEH